MLLVNVYNFISMEMPHPKVYNTTNYCYLKSYLLEGGREYLLYLANWISLEHWCYAEYVTAWIQGMLCTYQELSRVISVKYTYTEDFEVFWQLYRASERAQTLSTLNIHPSLVFNGTRRRDL